MEQPEAIHLSEILIAPKAPAAPATASDGSSLEGKSTADSSAAEPSVADNPGGEDREAWAALL